MLLVGMVVLIVIAGFVVIWAGRDGRATEHSPVYNAYMRSPAWTERRRQCLQWTHHRCSLFPWLRAVEAHHLHYRNLHRERVVRDLVPVSRLAHDLIIHRWICWRGPLRLPMTWWLRATCVATSIWVRPVLRWIMLLMMISACIELACIWSDVNHGMGSLANRVIHWFHQSPTGYLPIGDPNP